jgi:hypothetical protein
MVLSLNYPNNSVHFAAASRKVTAAYPANTAGAAAGPAKDSPTTAAASQSLNGVRTYDFTSMTQSQMQGVARELGKSGKIDLHQSLRLMLTPVIPLGEVGPNGAYRLPTAEQANNFYNQPVNYLQKLRDMMAFMEKSGQASDPMFGYDGLKNTLAVLQAMQGTTSSVNITA